MFRHQKSTLPPPKERYNSKLANLQVECGNKIRNNADLVQHSSRSLQVLDDQIQLIITPQLGMINHLLVSTCFTLTQIHRWSLDCPLSDKEKGWLVKAAQAVQQLSIPNPKAVVPALLKEASLCVSSQVCTQFRSCMPWKTAKAGCCPGAGILTASTWMEPVRQG